MAFRADTPHWAAVNCADLLVLVAGAALESQRPDGSMPAGHNGPYGEPETSLRNSSHWLHTFLKAYSITGERRFEDAARRISRVLLRPEMRPGGHTFHYRTAPGKDHCSGLIGQAWTIESLALASSHFQTAEHVVLALNVYRAHPFDNKLGLWRIREIDGSARGFDQTLNHQVWFAAAASRLLSCGAPDLRLALDVFLERLPDHLELFPNGLIHHPIPHLQSRRNRIRTSPSRAVGSRLFPRALLRRPSVAKVASLYMKCVGYHAFCAHGLATLKLQIPAHSFWRSSAAHRVARYLQSREYASLIEAESRYGFPYNAPGFEVPFAVATLTGSSDAEASQLASWWVTAQARRTFNPTTMRFDKGTSDPATLTARIYEMSGLSDQVLRGAVLGDLRSLDGRHRDST
jgi:hypothetical protein